MTDQKSSNQPKWLLYVVSTLSALGGSIGFVKGVSSSNAGLLIPSIISLVSSVVLFFIAKTGSAFVTKKNATQNYEDQNAGPHRPPIHSTPMTEKHNCAESNANTHDKTKDNKITTTQKIGAILFVLSFIGLVFSLCVVFTTPKGPARATALDIFCYSLFTIIFSCGMLYPGELPNYDSSSYTPPMDDL